LGNGNGDDEIFEPFKVNKSKVFGDDYDICCMKLGKILNFLINSLGA